MKNEQILKTIDCTPTWEALLPLLLEIYVNSKTKVKSSFSQTEKTLKAINSCKELEAEFLKMAKAADAHNRQLKAMQGK